jgi:MraZ protein
MLLGQYQLELTEDRSLVLPDQFGKTLGGSVYVTRGFEQNLLLMSEKVFEAIYQRVISLNIADPLARLLLRLILSNAARIDLDSTGKILIPETLASAAGLQKDVVLVGQGDYAEFWSPENWEEQAHSLLDAEANAARFSQLDLALN